MGKEKKENDKKVKLSREKLLKELSNLSKEIEEDGLLFLIKQANVLLYNQGVRAVNKKVSSQKVQQEKKPHKEEKPNYEVEIVEKSGGEHFYIVIGGARVFFTRDEMRSLVKICHAAEDEIVAARRLYNWFTRERKDLLIDGQISAGTHPSLKSIYRKLISTYKVKG
ncbi:MAG: hypothetical protein JSV25_07575 [Spirochaetota bacterium]|nr:MAG: hypothetical protein JSV25_07575 [Spirochaetota bacterium]